MSNHKPFLLVFSAPSGCGKTTLLQMLREKFAGIGFSVSHTTRPIRKGEVDGIDYHFINREQFTEMFDAGLFVESATVHLNSYGTSFAAVDTLLSEGKDVILDIDVQGMQRLKAANRYDFASIFIMPPGLDALASRLRLRNTDSDQVIRQRLINAEVEIKSAVLYDYNVVNDELNKAFMELSAIITAERLRTVRIKL